MLRRLFPYSLFLALFACAADSRTGTPGTGGLTSGGVEEGSSSGSTGGSSSSGGESGTGGPQSLGVRLTGPLAFPVEFAGEFYGFLPDGGADLSNLDCRISDGTDLGALCSPPNPASQDGGPTPSHEILDIYVTSVSGTALHQGTAAVSQPYSTDGGTFATIDLTYLWPDGGWDFNRALSGQVSYQATPSGMFGQFQALFLIVPDGGGVLQGTFGAGYCGSLSGY